MSERRFCSQPDRDAPRMKCGYPLPCPHHTAIMDMAGNVIMDPTTKPHVAARLGQVAKAIRLGGDEEDRNVYQGA